MGKRCKDNRNDPRKEKRWFRKNWGDYVALAYERGQGDAYANLPQRNIYPAGKRHDAYNTGYHSIDPMGDHFGRNV